MSWSSSGHSGPTGDNGLFQEDPQLSRAEIANVPNLAEWVLQILRSTEGSVSGFATRVHLFLPVLLFTGTVSLTDRFAYARPSTHSGCCLTTWSLNFETNMFEDR